MITLVTLVWLPYTTCYTDYTYSHLATVTHTSISDSYISVIIGKLIKRASLVRFDILLLSGTKWQAHHVCQISRALPPAQHDCMSTYSIKICFTPLLFQLSVHLTVCSLCTNSVFYLSWKYSIYCSSQALVDTRRNVNKDLIADV